MKQTAVDWLHEEYMRILKDNDISVFQAFEILDKYNHANEMFDEQIKEAHLNGQSEWDIQSLRDTQKKLSEQYYNETYKINKL
jgi:hypothetical protein